MSRINSGEMCTLRKKSHGTDNDAHDHEGQSVGYANPLRRHGDARRDQQEADENRDGIVGFVHSSDPAKSWKMDTNFHYSAKTPNRQTRNRDLR